MLHMPPIAEPNPSEAVTSAATALARTIRRLKFRARREVCAQEVKEVDIVVNDENT